MRDFESRVRALTACDVVVTNSAAEAALLRADSRCPLPPVRVAPSGVDDVFFGGRAERGFDRVGLKRGEPFVLCVARVEPIKNQHSLARAMRPLDAPLVLIGDILQGNEAYFRACRRVLPSIVHLRALAPPELADVYAAAAVHVLPSWYETTGLASAEALASGTPIVVGEGPCVTEYFADCARVAAPGDARALRRGIISALERPLGCEREVARRYTWSRTAAALLEAYDEAIKLRQREPRPA
jgi:glycosyltransferase involved in cell wall biosynthesis